MRVRVVPYKRGSKSAKLLAEKLSTILGYKVFRGLPKLNRININWGWVGNLPSGVKGQNDPTYVECARDKLFTFQKLQEHDVPIPEFTTDKAQAEEWVSNGKTVLARTRTGQGGSGITICSDSVVDAPLYTLYIKKKQEFRVHVVHGEAVFVQEKRKRRDSESDPLIRSHKRGWVFCKQDVVEPEGLRESAVRAVNALNLDFGAVDVIYNKRKGQVYVLEVNTAPGLCNQTGEIYANRIVNS